MQRESRLSPSKPIHRDVFVAGESGVHTYRIPSVVTTGRGTVLAFCEARKVSLDDRSPTMLVLKRSRDLGQTWSPLRTLHDDGGHAFMDPTVVEDRDTGRVWVFHVRYSESWSPRNDPPGLKHPSATVWAVWTDDDGITWSRPRDMTRQFKRPSWSSVCLGPGVGIQLAHGKRAGRLIVPQRNGGGRGKPWHVIYSDDHGRSWKIGKGGVDQAQEIQVAELPDGTLLANCRSCDSLRSASRSRDSGQTWTPLKKVPGLIEPFGCQGSLLRYAPAHAGGSERVLFSNPAHPTIRRNLTVRMSDDGGRTWPVARVVYPGWTAYSCLTVLPDGTIGVLYESGAKSPYEKIVFARFSLAWLTRGKGRAG